MQKRILLVDDDAKLLKGMRRTLEDFPFAVFTAQSANEAKAVMQTMPFDVVISDYRMPGESGVDLLVWVSENFPNCHRILLTGQPDIPSMARAINRAGIYQFLQKPVSQDELLESVYATLQH